MTSLWSFTSLLRVKLALQLETETCFCSPSRSLIQTILFSALALWWAMWCIYIFAFFLHSSCCLQFLQTFFKLRTSQLQADVTTTCLEELHCIIIIPVLRVKSAFSFSFNILFSSKISFLSIITVRIWQQLSYFIWHFTTRYPALKFQRGGE